MSTPWVDLFEITGLRGRARRVFGPAARLSLRVMPDAVVQSIAAGPGTFVRLFDSACPLETIFWMRPNSVVNAITALTDARIDAVDILAEAPVAGMAGYELFIARFSVPSEHH